MVIEALDFRREHGRDHEICGGAGVPALRFQKRIEVQEPGMALFTREFYSECRRVLKKGGVLVTQNGLPLLEGRQLKRSVAYFRDLFADAFAYLATTPSHVGGPLSIGWATDNERLRRLSKGTIEKRYAKAPFETRYWRPDVHVAAFALPGCVLELFTDR